MDVGFEAVVGAISQSLDKLVGIDLLHCQSGLLKREKKTMNLRDEREPL